MTASICEAALEYWNRIRGDLPLPRRDQFDPFDIPRLLPFVVFLEVVDGGRDFRYRVIGSDARAHFFENYTGRMMGDLAHVEPEGPLLTKLRTAVSGKQPQRVPAEYVGPLQDIRKQDEIVLPLSDATGTVSHLLVFLEFSSSR